jgi:hypothetical protein
MAATLGSKKRQSWGQFNLHNIQFPERGSSGEKISEETDLMLGLKKEAMASKRNCRTRTRDSHMYAGAHICFHSTDSLDSAMLCDNKYNSRIVHVQEDKWSVCGLSKYNIDYLENR